MAALRTLVTRLPEDVEQRFAVRSKSGSVRIGGTWSRPLQAGVSVVQWKRQASRHHGEQLGTSAWGFYMPVQSRNDGWRIGLEGFTRCAPADDKLGAYAAGILRVMEAFAPFNVDSNGRFAGLDDPSAYRAMVQGELAKAGAELAGLGRNMTGFAKNFFVEPTLKNRSAYWWQTLHGLWSGVATAQDHRVRGELVIPGKRSETTSTTWTTRVSGRLSCEPDAEGDDCILLVGTAEVSKPLGLGLEDDEMREVAMIRMIAEPATLRPREFVETIVQDSAIIHIDLLRVVRLNYDMSPQAFDPCRPN